MQSNNWQISETTFTPRQQHTQETIFSIGNGYLGTRGTFEEGYPGENAVTLIHGVFDEAPVVYSELANTPNWVAMEVLLGGERFRLDRGTVLAYQRCLDLSAGVLRRQIVWESPARKRTKLEFERFASLADEHILGVKVQVTPLNWSGAVEFRAGLCGYVDNDGLAHWQPADQGQIDTASAYLTLRTRSSQITLCEAFHLNAGVEARYTVWDSQGQPVVKAVREVSVGQTASAEKLVVVATSRDGSDPQWCAIEKLTQAVHTGYADLFAANQTAWQQEWERCDVTIEGDDPTDLALRFSIFQLLIAAPRHDDRVSIAAKSLTGFGYRGHVFWDTETFVLPFFTYTSPHIARNLLMYRYHTLPGARRKAQENGCDGAMFAWESAASGDETTPCWVPGPDRKSLIRIWSGDLEIHISADVAYAVMQYWKVSGDDAFFREYGAEIVLDTARFWGSRAEWKPERGRYEISAVIGPDEYHDHVNNNAFTNLMAQWNLQAGLAALDWLKENAPQKAGGLIQDLDLSPQRMAHWAEVIEKIVTGYQAESGLFEQFDGYFQLQPIDQADYESRTESFQGLLGIEGVQAYQIIKQPDVLMLFHLLPEQFSAAQLQANWDYYTPRTDLALGSSLGPAIQAAIAARLGDVDSSYRHFLHGAQTDLGDARGNTHEGTHAATHGGLWQAAVFGFGGLALERKGPQARPHLPQGWTRLAYRIQYHGQTYEYSFQPDSPTEGLALLNNPTRPIAGAIFDLDGVLANTAEYHYLAWKRLADEEGIPFDREDNDRLRGVDRRESLLLLLNGRQYPEARYQELMDRKNHYYIDLISRINGNSLLPGAKAFLQQVKAAGIRIAIGSSSKNARAVIEKLGLAPLVDTIADGNSVARQKPAPDLFMHAAELLGLSPQQCVVFEDAQAGIEAARAGGMWSIGIGPADRVGAAHLIYPNLDGLDWGSIQKHLSALAEPI